LPFQLTNLSIKSKLDALQASGKLHAYVPTSVGRVLFARRIWLTTEAKAWQADPAKGKPEESLAELEAHMNDFSTGQQMIDGWNLKWLNPRTNEFWEFRTPMCPVQLRLFGWFPSPNFFVAVHGKTRNELGDNEAKWDKATAKIHKARTDLLPGTPPYHGNNFEDYLRL
jgi:hypothetical protein